MPYTFAEFLRQREIIGEDLKDLGVNLQDPKTQQAFVTALQKNAKNLNLKKVASDTLANPNSQPDKTQLKADQEYQFQQDMLAGKAAPVGVPKKDWEDAVQTFVPKGQPPVPNLIGKGKPADPIGTLEKGAAQGAIPQDSYKYAPYGMKMKDIKPKTSSTTPQIDPKQMSPSQLAKSKSQPKQPMM